MTQALQFCTLFDSNYLSRGVLLYESLEKHCAAFTLYVLCFDDACYDILSRLNKPQLRAIRLADFEDPELLAIKPGRTRAEYCWTSTASLILYCIRTFNLSHCTYLDADMLFYSSPQALLDEVPEAYSVMITEHRYTKQYDQSRLSGKYCVQFMYFKNTAEGMAVLTWWRNACIEWCYNRAEDGKFGDQKYLDDWTTRFKGVWELKNQGGGLAPWNCQQYTFRRVGDIITGVKKDTGEVFKAVFFHFHGTRFYRRNRAIFSNKSYLLSPAVRRIFYRPYQHAIYRKELELETVAPGISVKGRGSLAQYLQELILKGNIVTIKRNFLRR